MSKVLRAMAVLLWCFSAAQAEEPVVELTLAEDSVAVGQPVVLRLTVLVPSFMPSPPNLPSFETPNLMVRLNGRATSPTSKPVNGETWSGVTRSYTLYPMVAGTFEIPAQEVSVTYRGEGTEDLTSVVTTEPFTLTGLVPEGAERLDPLLVATGLTATQEITLPEGKIAMGDAVQRNLTVTIKGAPPLFVPPLLGLSEESALRAYPKEPVLTESVDRGVVSGTRQEAASYVAIAEGPAELPEITLEWFNITSGQVETIVLEGAQFEVAPGPAAPVSWDRGLILRALASLVALVALGFALCRYGYPRWQHWWEARKAAKARAAPQMFRQIEAAAAAQDLSLLLRRIAAFETAHGTLPPSLEFDAALSRVTAVAYGDTPVPPAETAARWAALTKALTARKPGQNSVAREAVLPALNPL
ncbi:BatD family protein [Dinoroseobacter sp. S76]|uniref:BatD family protein n=1 Tax=Dinoroseobacter sp. S76 TaxID=3415124 RepID=UPI003C79B38E